MKGRFKEFLKKILLISDFKSDRVPNIAFIIRLDSLWILLFFLFIHVIIVLRTIESDVLIPFLSHPMTYIYTISAVMCMLSAKWLKKTILTIFGIDLSNPTSRFTPKCKIGNLITSVSLEKYQKDVYHILTKRWINYLLIITILCITLPNYPKLILDPTYHIYLWDKPSANSFLGIVNAIFFPIYAILTFGMGLPLIGLLFQMIRSFSWIGTKKYPLELRTFSELDNTDTLSRIQKDDFSKFSLRRFKRKAKFLPNTALKYSLLIVFIVFVISFVFSYYLAYFSNLGNNQMAIFMLVLLITLNIFMVLVTIIVFIVPQRALKKLIEEEKTYRINSFENLYKQNQIQYYHSLLKGKTKNTKLTTFAENMRTIDYMILDTKKILSWPFDYKQAITISLSALSAIISTIFPILTYFGIF